MRRKSSASPKKMHGIQQISYKMRKDQSFLVKSLTKSFLANVYENQYTLHPSQLRDIASEEIESLLSFLETFNTEVVCSLGETRAHQGVNLATILCIRTTVQDYFLDTAQSHSLSIIREVIPLLDQYMTHYLTGFSLAKERKLLTDQEQLRKALSATLSRQEQELHIKTQAIHSSRLGILLTRLDGRISYANPAFLRLWGYESPDEVLHASCQQFLPDADIEGIKKTLTTTSWQNEIILENQHNSSNTIAISASFIKGEHGHPVGLMMYYEDISDKKQLEAQLRHSQKLEAVGSLAGGVAHDFNNILSIIIGHSSLLLKQLNPSDKIHEVIRKILKAGEQGESLTQQLLAFSRKQVLRAEIIDLNTLIETTGSMLQRLLSENIEFHTNLTAENPWVKVDAQQMEQVILNLAINAKDAMPDGGQLLIETQNINLDSHYVGRHKELEPGPFVMLSISDTGTGMDKKTKDRCFEPFFTTKHAGKGTGLGLSTFYGIIKQLQGHIAVYSEPDRGTTFKIYLPRKSKSPRYESQSFSNGSDSHAVMQTLCGSETVLLIEDDEDVRETTSSILREHGYTVLEAGHGMRALQIAAESEKYIDLILTDIIMPKMSGFEAVEKLSEIQPDAQILYMSGYNEHLMFVNENRQKEKNFIQKPFAADELLQKIRMLLDN